MGHDLFLPDHVTQDQDDQSGLSKIQIILKTTSHSLLCCSAQLGIQLILSFIVTYFSDFGLYKRDPPKNTFKFQSYDCTFSPESPDPCQTLFNRLVGRKCE